MIVCQCLATSDSAIARLAAQGRVTVADITSACGAGSDCGSCIATIAAVLEHYADRQVSGAAVPLPRPQTAHRALAVSS